MIRCSLGIYASHRNMHLAHYWTFEPSQSAWISPMIYEVLFILRSNNAVIDIR